MKPRPGNFTAIDPAAQPHQKMRTIHRVSLSFALAAVLGLAASPAGAQGIVLPCGGGTGGTFTCSQAGGDLEAEVTFAFSTADLMVTLTNISEIDVTGASQVLTAVFFDIAGDPALTPDSAMIATGSTVIPSGSPTGGGNVGGEWAFKWGLSGAPGDANFGISSAGLGLFGDANFGGANLEGPGSGAVDGPQYGITSAAAFDDPSTYNGRFTPLIQNSVKFTLGGPPYGSPLTASNVSVVYGTSLGAPIPEPASLLLLGSGLVGLGAGAWRRSRRS